METVKDVSIFCKAVIFYNYKNLGIIDELNKVRKSITNNFHETIPVSRILITLSILGFIIFKSNDNDFENVLENIHELGANMLYMIGFGKVVKDDGDKVII